MRYLLPLLLLLALLLPLNYAKAQVTSSGVAISVPIEETVVSEGDIICSYQEGNKKCVEEYDTSIFGVITDNSAVAIKDTELENSRLLATNGVARVKVTTVNGNIEEGDFITASNRVGVGQKASKNGYVLGSALEAYQNADREALGTIQVMINVHPESSLTGSRGNLLQFIRSGISVPIFDPVESLRYLLAVAIVLISFTLGMVYFGRASRAGIEAVGRNPLAKKVIQFTVLMNVLLTLVIVMVGLGIAYLILVL